MGDDSPVDVADGEGDMSSPSRAAAGEGGEDKLDEGGVIRSASSVTSDRRSPVDRFMVSGLCSGDASTWVSTMGDLEPWATGVVSPSVDIEGVSAESNMALEKNSQLVL
jgi:hypothetical protein